MEDDATQVVAAASKADGTAMSRMGFESSVFRQPLMRKLIRDKIPQIIDDNGGLQEHLEIVTCNDNEKLSLLLDKVTEEASELIADPSLEEMADVLEVVYTLAEVLGHDVGDLEQVRKQKRKLRGGFTKGLVLQSK